MSDSTQIKNENVVAGIVGAFLFSLGGGAVYFLLSYIGFISFASGLIGVVLACLGFTLFSGRESVRGIIISSVIALLAIVLAWYLKAGFDYYQACAEWFENGEIEFKPTYGDCVRSISSLFKEVPEIFVEYLKDLILALLFAAIGSFSYVFTRIRNAKAEEDAAKRAEASSPANYDYSYSEPSEDRFDLPEEDEEAKKDEELEVMEELEEDEEADEAEEDDEN